MQEEQNISPTFKAGTKMLVTAGKHAGSIGVVDKVIPKYHVKLNFAGTSKTLPAEHIEKMIDGGEITALFK